MYLFVFILGVTAYVCILFSFLTGMKFIKVKFRIHRAIGITGFILATIHAILMLLNTFIGLF